MLTAIGIDSDPTLVHFVQAALNERAGLTLLNLRAAVEGEWRLPLGSGEPAEFTFGGEHVSLAPGDAIYCRLIDLSPVLPERETRRRWRSLIGGLAAWLEQSEGVVVNRPGHAADNSAKPLHEAWLRQQGFAVPASLTSSNATLLAAFAGDGPTIVKSVQGIRADTRAVTPADFTGFVAARGPVHLQRRVIGRDLRLHVVGNEVHGESIESDAVDYRTASARFRRFEVPADLADLTVRATRAAGLIFAGWDFKLDDEGRFWCLEANPMPGYDGYDTRANGAISRSLVERLKSRR
ncbi:ATP-grasp domain-containing protein [Hypericibacter sp.]|uniref:ATP-grasp domain-containing protein n=1 Tax=Hypericibacter sp. TaxID=2705401 RepID=UPI003D6D4B9E